jgi:predicted nucleic acid-binding Zn ribbon protein
VSGTPEGDSADEFPSPPEGDLDAATTAALARARAAAIAKGLRPGQRPRRRRRVEPGGPTYSGADRDSRDPALLGDQLERLRAEHGWDLDLAAGSVLARWDHIVGSDIASHAQPVTIDDGVLTVQASSTAWATQLRLMTPALIGRVADEVGPGVVTSITVVGPAAPSWRKGQRRAPGPGPRDTYG